MKKNILTLIFLSLFLTRALSQNDIKIVNVSASGMAYSKTADRLWVSVPSNTPQYGNSICRINPNFGTIEASYWAGSEPRNLTLSPSGRYLFVGFEGTPKIRRFDTQANVFDQEFYLQGDDTVNISNFYPSDIAMLPKKENSLVVARGNSGLEVYDNGKHRRLATAGLRGGRSVNFGLDTTTVWSLGVPYYGDGILKLKVDTAGIQTINSYNTVVSDVENSIKFSPFDSLFYTDAGIAFDVRSGVPVKKFQLGTNYLNDAWRVLPDPYNSDVYFFAAYNDINVKVYNSRLQIPIDQYILPAPNTGIAETLNWGGAGKIVLRGYSNRVIIIRTCTSQAVAPTITEGATVKGCAGSEIILTASGTANRYYWNTGDTTRSIKVRNAGTYTVGLPDATGCLAQSAPTTVSLTNLPSSPSIYIENFGSNTVCRDRTIRLLVGSSGSNRYEWSNGTIGTTNLITQSGSYKCVAVSPEGCRSAPSDSITITIVPRNSPIPIISVVGDTFFCANARTTLVAPNGYLDYYWTSSNSYYSFDQKVIVEPTYTSIYSLVVTDSFGCKSPTVTKKIEVVGNYAPYIFLFQSLLQTQDMGDSYQWFLNGVALKDSIKPTMRPSVNGFYSLQVTRKGCKSLLSAPVSFIRTAISQLADNQLFDVSPNPMNSILRLYTVGVENGTIEVRDVLGRLVTQIAAHTGEEILSVADWQTGVYFVHLKTVKGTTLAIRRVLKF